MEMKDIKNVKIHWSESALINKELGCDSSGDIEKYLTPIEADDLIKRAAPLVGSGYDKTSMTVTFFNKKTWDQVKFYLTPQKTGLLELLA